MRRPSDALVIDAAVLIALVLGRQRRVLEGVAAKRKLVTTERAVAESARRLELGMERPDLLPVLALTVADVDVIPPEKIHALESEAARALVNAPASRNGSARDAHVLACAWAVEGDIWTFDRDFAETGVASWSTANLLKALA